MYTVLRNNVLGKAVIIDNDKRRLWRMRDRVNKWIDTIPEENNMFMITLTYDYNGSLGFGKFKWNKNDIRNFNIKFRQFMGKDLLGYAWVLEVMKSGKPHYHYICILAKGAEKRIPFVDKFKIWEKGLSRVEKVRTPFYILKYTGKEYQKKFEYYPKGARLFGVWLKGKTEELRYKMLKESDKEIVDNWGWDILKLLKQEKGQSNWHLAGNTDTLEGALCMSENLEYAYNLTEVIDRMYEYLENPDLGIAF